MSLFQYVTEGHTFIKTAKDAVEKTKVVYGEIVEIENDLYEDGRMLLAGFQKVVDGVDDMAGAIYKATIDLSDALITDSEDLKTDESNSAPVENEVSTGDADLSEVQNDGITGSDETTEEKPKTGAKKARNS